MANTYTQLYVHYVFAVSNRRCLIGDAWKTDLYKYMNGIIEKNGNKPFKINGTSDHVHILVSMNPTKAPSDLMYHAKRSSALWINQQRFINDNFSWQEGFGAFSLGKTQVPAIVNYIESQEHHHNKQSFINEYLMLLNEYEIVYDEKYIFREV